MGGQLSVISSQPLPDLTVTSSAALPKTAAPKKDQSFLGKLWNAVNTPVGDFVLPEGIKTADVLKAVGFHALGMGPYIPGVNDEHTISEQKLNDTPTKAALKTFLAGAGADTANTVAGFTSPLALGTMAAGAATKLPGAMGTVARAVTGTAGAGFAAKGGADIIEVGTENTPEAWQKRLQGGAMVAGGAAALEATTAPTRAKLSAPLGNTPATVRGTIPPEQFTPQELQAYAEQNGLPPLTAAQATEHVGLRNLQSAGERATLGGQAVKQQIKGQQAAIVTHAEDLMDTFSPKTPDTASAGAAIQKGVEAALEKQQTAATENYSAVDKAAEGTTVDLGPVRDIAQKILGSSKFLRDIGGLDPKKATGILQNIVDAPESATFTEAQQLRSALLDASRSPDLAISNTAQGWIKQLTGGVDSQMMAAAKGTPGLENAFRAANDHWTRLQEDFNDSRSPLSQILKEPDPSKVPQKLTQKGQTGGSPYNAGLLDTYGIDKGPLKRIILDDMLSKDFRLWNKNLAGYGDDFLKSVFSPGELADLYKTGGYARSVGLNTNPSGTAAVTGAMQDVTHPAGAILKTGAAKLTNSPAFNQRMMRSGKAIGRRGVPLSSLAGMLSGRDSEDQ
ncbi:MAG TPA: hypothetical protein VNH65_03245 [Candidatus Acidoferrum sp.]|nr:hypothetical protein [Candidatus Acidoferrum sp.]